MNGKPMSPPPVFRSRGAATVLEDEARCHAFMKGVHAAFREAFGEDAVAILGGDLNHFRMGQAKEDDEEYDLVLVTVRYAVRARRNRISLVVAAEPRAT